MEDDLDEPASQEKIVEIKLKKPKVIKIPKREPSIVVPSREIIFITADKTTCEFCVCFPKESPYVIPQKVKLHPCMTTPWTLYEYAELAVEKLLYPKALEWTIDDVVDWMVNDVGFPEYESCIRENKIDGKRLLMLEDPSKLARMNIRYWEHHKIIVSKIKKLYDAEYIYFKRSIGLPRRKLLALFNWFKSRTGPTWGIRMNWKRCDLLRAMQILNPKPRRIDHWEWVWYQKPDFYKTLFCRIPPAISENEIPHYVYREPECLEYTAPRKFHFDTSIPKDGDFVWMQHRPESNPNLTLAYEAFLKQRKSKKVYPGARLCPEPVSLKGKRGKQYFLAKRKAATPKFNLDCGSIPARV